MIHPTTSELQATYNDIGDYNTKMITDDMERLYDLKKELRSESKKYRNSVKPLKDEIKLLEADIIKQVLEAGKTITVGGIKAEYKPTVIISMKKEKENE